MVVFSGGDELHRWRRVEWCVLQIKASPFNIFIQVHVLAVDASKEEGKVFYGAVQDALRSCPGQEIALWLVTSMSKWVSSLLTERSVGSTASDH